MNQSLAPTSRMMLISRARWSTVIRIVVPMITTATTAKASPMTPVTSAGHVAQPVQPLDPLAPIADVLHEIVALEPVGHRLHVGGVAEAVLELDLERRGQGIHFEVPIGVAELDQAGPGAHQRLLGLT